jgi:hypothetical protein
LIDLNVPGFNFHGLQGIPKRYSIHVNGPWCITFEWEEDEALRVDLESHLLETNPAFKTICRIQYPGHEIFV